MLELQSVVEELQTINDFARWAVSRFKEADLFYGHGTDNAWDEAVSLILHVLSLDYELPESAWQARLTRKEKIRLVEVLMRRIEQRIPAPYLTHNMRFANLDFYVDENVLIPRSPVAELIIKRFEPWLHNDHASRILDLCTGSGCIAIACAAYLPEAQVDAVDISKEALVIAAKNGQKHHCEERVQFYQGDLFAPLAKQGQYDIIISNPPYVDAVDMANLPPEYHHEPALALAAGVDGLEIVDRILNCAKDYLKPHGVLIVEVGNSEKAIMDKYPNVPFTWLDFEQGADGVFLLTHADLQRFL